jgi:mevalonate kinase
MALRLHPSASACGKVILLGEHAVVYGFPALAAGLADSLRLRAEPLSDARAPVELCIPEWDLDITLDPSDDHAVARACSEVLSFCDGPLTGWRIEGNAELPARAGLGSSAALTVALARLVLGSDADLSLVVEASLRGERIFHGEPSGIDSEVAARGGILRFVRGEPVETIPLREPLQLGIIPSGVPRSTADQVAKVRYCHDRWTMIARPMLQLIGVAVGEAIASLNKNDLDSLGEIMNLNHHLLGGLNVSSPILDAMCSAARAGGARGAKLTGAGGGGCILALPPDPAEPLLTVLREQGYAPFRVTVR